MNKRKTPDLKRQSSNNQFLNPYNFVRFLPFPYDRDVVAKDIDEKTVIGADADKIGQLLLGKCPPPGHDRYVALSGRIVCVAENVTPLFVSDAHEIKIGQKNTTLTGFSAMTAKRPCLPPASAAWCVLSLRQPPTPAWLYLMENIS